MQLSKLCGWTARKLQPVDGALDKAGMEFVDYQQILAIHALEKSAGRSLDGADLEKWQYVVVQNYSRSLWRKLKRIRSVYSSLDFYQIPSTDDVAGRVEAREICEILKGRISHEDYQIMCLVADEGSLKGAWEIAGGGLAYRTFCRKVERIKKQCKKVVKNMPLN